jgi:2-hydroxy-3-oxopropionate reductase
MTAIGFIGLGIMGSHMAANLVRAGHSMTGYDVVPAAVDRLAQAGGKPGAERGVRVLDAPVSGGEQGAIKASLSIMVGGEAPDFEAARPIFEDLGRTIVHVGGHGAGQTVKAANQLMVAGIISLVSEAIVLLEASGVDGERGLEVLAGGLAGNRILDLKAATMLAREFEPGFRIDLHHKDMGIALASARAAGVALPVTGVVAQLVAAARAQGHGSLDHSALLKVVEQLSAR